MKFYAEVEFLIKILQCSSKNIDTEIALNRLEEILEEYKIKRRGQGDSGKGDRLFVPSKEK